MRISGGGAVTAVTVSTGAARRSRAPEHRVERYGAVATQRQALVTDRLPVAQGQTNACGTVSLWLVLGQFGRATQTWQQLDAEVRPWDFGSSPGVLAQAARDRGLVAQVYNRGTFLDLERDTQAGRGVLVMTDVGGYDRPNGDMLPGDPSDFGSHWMRVTRAWEDSNGQRWVEYDNPWGTREVLHFEQFDALWMNQRLGGLATGYDRAYLLVDRPTAPPLPSTNAHEVAAVMAASDGAQQFARGIASLASGQLFSGLGHLAGGVVTGAAGLVGSALALPGTWLQQAGEALLGVSKRGEREGGLAAIGGALAGAAGAVVAGLGAAVAAVGNSLALAGQALGAMAQGAFSALARLFG